MISAEIVEDTISDDRVRLTTFKLVYPSIVHPELLTHKALSRSVSSNRAIPIAKMIDSIEADMAEPVEWGKNMPGMQARELLDETDKKAAMAIWRTAGRQAVKHSRDLAATGAHKQIANRVTMPWQHVSVVLTATDYDNFFALRCHEDADPTMAELAWSMAHTYYNSCPVPARPMAWCHLPFVSAGERATLSEGILLQASVARCARVSYRNHDGSFPILDKDIELARDLQASGHWSPFEHQGMPAAAGSRSGNFRGWAQFRQTFDKQCIKNFDYDAAMSKLTESGKRIPGLKGAKK
jgi:thymidylate synthase ThyX